MPSEKIESFTDHVVPALLALLLLFFFVGIAFGAPPDIRATPISASVTNCGVKVSASLRAVSDGVFISGATDKSVKFTLLANNVIFKTCLAAMICSGAAPVAMMTPGENTVAAMIELDGCNAGVIGYVDLQ